VRRRAADPETGRPFFCEDLSANRHEGRAMDRCEGLFGRYPAATAATTTNTRICGEAGTWIEIPQAIEPATLDLRQRGRPRYSHHKPAANRKRKFAQHGREDLRRSSAQRLPNADFFGSSRNDVAHHSHNSEAGQELNWAHIPRTRIASALCCASYRRA